MRILFFLAPVSIPSIQRKVEDLLDDDSGDAEGAPVRLFVLERKGIHNLIECNDLSKVIMSALITPLPKMPLEGSKSFVSYGL